MSGIALWWDQLRSSFWFLASVIVAAFVLLAVVLVEVDTAIGSSALRGFPRLFAVGADGTRGMLEAIAGATITVAGVVFSVTIVALSAASSQYSPRVLRNFMRDRANQVALGVFVGTYAYCLVVLRTIHGGDKPFVPSIAAVVAIVLAFVAIGVLILFIHHISTSIQAARIVHAIHAETGEAVDRLYPEILGDAAQDEETPSSFGAAGTWHEIPSDSAGYVQTVDDEGLLALACEHDVVVKLRCRIGDFVVRGAALAMMSGGAGPRLASRARRLIAIGEQRSMTQDAAFGIRQLVDVGLKALSPAVNDATTAAMCVDRLSALLLQLADRQIPSPLRTAGGKVRVVAPTQSFTSLLELALEELRHASRTQPAVLERLARLVASLEQATASTGRLRSIAAQAARLRETAQLVDDAAWRTRVLAALERRSDDSL